MACTTSPRKCCLFRHLAEVRGRRPLVSPNKIRVYPSPWTATWREGRIGGNVRGGYVPGLLPRPKRHDGGLVTGQQISNGEGQGCGCLPTRSSPSIFVEIPATRAASKAIAAFTKTGTQGLRETPALICAFPRVFHQARSPQTNGVCERFPQTIQKEFYASALRRKL